MTARSARQEIPSPSPKRRWRGAEGTDRRPPGGRGPRPLRAGPDPAPSRAHSYVVRDRETGIGWFVE